MRLRLTSLTTILPLLVGCAAATPSTTASPRTAPATTPATCGPCGTLTTPPTYTHVIWVL